MRGPSGRRRSPDRLAVSTVLIVVALVTGSCSDQFEPTPSLPSAEVAAVTAPVIFVGAGDISGCTSTGDSRTALLVESILNANPTAWAFVAGDNVYEDGSTVEYRDCYGPTWGRFKTRTRPSLGNHEYDGIEGPTPSFDYFGDALWENSRDRGGYYSFNLGETWHIVVLNSNESFVPAVVGSPQDTWLKADLAANNRPCIAAVFHHPRFFSSTDPASPLSRSWVKPFWQALYAAGADLILNGHSHNYERFAPMNPDGVADPQKGIRQFIVGMGGKSVSTATNIAPNSEMRNGDTFGVMELTLDASSYSWRFVPEAGKSFTDAGTNNCHNPSGEVETNTPPSAAFTQTCSGLNCAFNSDASSDSDGIISSRGWQFGDGATSTQANPAHAYATAGNYTVNLTVTDDDGATNTVSHSIQVGSPPVGGGAVLVGAGDIAHCSLASDEATAKLLDALPAATVVTLGDNANSVGSATDFTNCYGPTWGRHKARTRPIPGYMDYKTAGATGYYGYFGSAAGTSGQGYYSYNLGDWHIVALNSMVSMSAGSAQEQWLRADLAANPKVCTLAYIARARFSSGKNGGATSVQPLWQALYERGADIILAGSDHSYERFARQTPTGAANPASGIQQFVVGTGGQSLTGIVASQPNSVVFNGSTFGVLKLTLGATGYSWEFVPVAGSTFTDAGSMDCVGAPPPVPNLAPTANFTQACTGLSCSFTDASSDNDGTIKSRSWEFGDGATSTATNPTHAFATGGTYSVKLTVTDDDDALSQPVTHSVTVAPIPNSPPTAAFEPNCHGLDCDFDNNSQDSDGTIVAWSWDFGDLGAGDTSDQPAPSHSYAEAGTYTVTLTVTDDDGAESAPVVKDITVAEPPVNAPPVAKFTAPSCTTGVVCSFQDQSTDDGSIVTRRWDFADPPGTVVSTSNGTISHTYNAPGDYPVTLTVVDNGGATSDPAAQHTVTVSDAPNAAPTASFTRSCNNLACTFTDQSSDADGTIKTRAWDFGDGSTSTAQNPSHTYAGGGSKTVTLTVTDNRDKPSAPATQTFSVVANLAPTASFTASCSGLTCAFTNGSSDSDGSIVGRSWTFGDGATSISNSPSRTYAAAGTYTVGLTVTDDDGATGTTTGSVTVTAPNRPPTALFVSACTKLSCTFTDQSTDPDGNSTIVAWSWAFGDGTSSTLRNPTHVYGRKGKFKVKLTVTDDRGTSDPVTHTVSVAP